MIQKMSILSGAKSFINIKNENICPVFSDAISDDAVRYQYVKKKGYVRLHTNKGDLNVELHCDKVTLTQTFFKHFVVMCAHYVHVILLALSDILFDVTLSDQGQI